MNFPCYIHINDNSIGPEAVVSSGTCVSKAYLNYGLKSSLTLTIFSGLGQTPVVFPDPVLGELTCPAFLISSNAPMCLHLI